jgi:hypothetical protein
VFIFQLEVIKHILIMKLIRKMLQEPKAASKQSCTILVYPALLYQCRIKNSVEFKVVFFLLLFSIICSIIDIDFHKLSVLIFKF